MLSVAADSVDAASLERHAEAGRRALADGDAALAAGELGAALDLWRGDALCDCRSGGWAVPEAIRLDELRLSTVEDRIDADLSLGRHIVLVSELESLVVRHPLRERSWAARMLAADSGGAGAKRGRTPAGVVRSAWTGKVRRVSGLPMRSGPAVAPACSGAVPPA